MQLFSADAMVFSKKLKKKFAPENMKKPLLKIGPQLFFSELARPKNRNPVPPKVS